MYTSFVLLVNTKNKIGKYIFNSLIIQGEKEYTKTHYGKKCLEFLNCLQRNIERNKAFKKQRGILVITEVKF